MNRESLTRISRFGAVVTAAQLASAGLSPDRIRAMVQQGVIAPLGRGVYARAALVEQAHGEPAGQHALRAAAALARHGPDAAASHQTAAVIHGLDLVGRLGADITLTRPPGSGSRTGGPGIRVHSAALPAAHVVVAGGIRVTSVPRTVADLGRTLQFREGVVAADSALHGKQALKWQLSSVLAGCPRWPGVDRARRVVEFSDARSESPLESLARVAFSEAGLPVPELQVWVGCGGVVIGRCDFFWRAHRTIGEADGAVKYSDPRRAMAQLQRDARLREAGFEVVHFTWWDIDRAPGQVAAGIRSAFRRGHLAEPRDGVTA